MRTLFLSIILSQVFSKRSGKIIDCNDQHHGASTALYKINSVKPIFSDSRRLHWHNAGLNCCVQHPRIIARAQLTPNNSLQLCFLFIMKHNKFYYHVFQSFSSPPQSQAHINNVLSIWLSALISAYPGHCSGWSEWPWYQISSQHDTILSQLIMRNTTDWERKYC